MKKWLMLIALMLGLPACSNSDEKVETKQEKLYSFLIVQDKLYVVGEHHDYQFEHDSVKELDGFLKSPYVKFINKIQIKFDVRLGGRVEGAYIVDVDMSKQPESERQKLVKDYGFTQYHYSGTSIGKYYDAEGKVVKLKNRDEILQKYRFQTPLDARLVYSGRLSEGQKTALATAISPITIPLGLAVGVLSVPFKLICFATACAY